MYRDNSLIPKEAIRMAALGVLAGGPRRYSAVASDVRQFSARIVGPSLDLLGTSIELLKFEGLITPLDGKGMEDDATLSITPRGSEALRGYLTAPVRGGGSELNKLVVALKLRFLNHLDATARIELLRQLRDMYEGERTRLLDLTTHDEWAEGLLPDWLALEIDQVERRIAWCQTRIDDIA